MFDTEVTTKCVTLSPRLTLHTAQPEPDLAALYSPQARPK